MRKIEFVFILVAFPFFISQFGMAQNQTLRINIELPAGVGLNSGSNSISSSYKNLSLEVGQETYGVKNFSLIAEDGSFVPLVWIKMQTYENSQFLLDFKNRDETGKTAVFYFLNDNSSNLQNAQFLKIFPALLNFNQKGLLIKSFVPRKVTLSAWLGIHRENHLKTLILEYF